MRDKKLTKSQDKMVSGVAGGIAEYFEIDPVLVRLAFVLLLFAGSGGFWLYIILMLIMPEPSVAIVSEGK